MGVVSSLPLSLLSSTSKPVLGTKNGQSGERRRYNIHTHSALCRGTEISFGENRRREQIPRYFSEAVGLRLASMSPNADRLKQREWRNELHTRITSFTVRAKYSSPLLSLSRPPSLSLHSKSGSKTPPILLPRSSLNGEISPPPPENGNAVCGRQMISVDIRHISADRPPQPAARPSRHAFHRRRRLADTETVPIP